ncbi:hypothetical protein [Coraliomargarita parva]|uniref:hypothetical protein n=1 Tax=Coraliomargarita parva TaxID=3014050 RepID=UPI0022B52E8E|nr:hypothetical protein [Coraliomargarita parva]
MNHSCLQIHKVCRSRFGICAGALFLALQVNAESLVSWSFDSNTRAPEGVNENITASNFGPEGNFITLALTPNSTVRGVGDTGYLQTWQAGWTYASEAEALANNTYFTFTLTPDENYEINISEISFYAWVNTAGPYDGGNYNYFLRSSVTGDTTLGTYTDNTAVNSSIVPTTDVQGTIVLSEQLSLQGVTEAVTFTIGVYSDIKPTAGFMRMDQIEVNGTVSAIPEPASWALSASVLALFVGVARRRKR